MLAVVLLLLVGCCSGNHLYYSIDRQNRYVSDSTSLKEITECKDRCMQMKQRYPQLHFRFHRLILRQEASDIKYFAGDCQWTVKPHKQKPIDRDYHGWEQLPKHDQHWKKYSLQCDNPKLKLSQQLIQSLKLTRTHSDFVYYDSGRFVNQQPFDDLSGLFKRVAQLQSSLK